MHHFPHIRTIRLLAAATTFMAAYGVLLLGPNRLEYPAAFHLQHVAIIFDSVLVATIFYASIGLLLGRRAAWIAAIVVLAGSAIWETVESRYVFAPLALLPLSALIVVTTSYRYYRIPSTPRVLSFALRRALIFTVISTLIGCLGFYVLAHSEHRRFSLVPSIIVSLEYMYSLSNIFEPLRHPSVSHAIGRLVLFVLGVANYSLIAFALLRPVFDEFVLTNNDYKRAKKLLDTYATSSEDYFKYFPTDKSYYFGVLIDGFVAYSVENSICIALSDPITTSDTKRQMLLQEFVNFCELKAWTIAFLPVTDENRELYSRHEFDSVKIGETAIVSLVEFIQVTALNKHFRNISNRFTKNNFSATLHQPPHSPEILAGVQTVSDDWLNSANHTERQFAMGYYNRDYLQSSQLFIVRDNQQTIQAFVNLHPSYSSTRASFDLMRSRFDAPKNIMDYLFAQLIAQLYNNGWHELDMGLAPLSGLDAKRSITERSLSLFYKYANRWFAFKGLHRFKDKFKPHWEPQFIMYRGSASRLPAIALAFTQLLKYKL